tara:strand:+ start:129 stop:419 length:291 start_codon:yes stop_codon:yes gene_type:complete
MKVEIGALLEKEYGQMVKDEVSKLKGVDYVFFATGRSSDLFEEKQFGSYGEAAIVTIIVDESNKEEVFDQVFELCELHTRKTGVVYMSNPMMRTQI